jgi:hypothetical protein
MQRHPPASGRPVQLARQRELEAVVVPPEYRAIRLRFEH